MRLFLALNLPEEIKEYLFGLQKKVKEAKITWVSKKNLHLTLKFLGDVEEKNLLKIKERLKITQMSLDVSLGHLGFFPNEKNPRVLWVSIEPEEQVIKLQQAIDAELLDIFPGEQKFQSHVTLGRIKSIRRKEDFKKSIDTITFERKSFRITSFHLMKSELRRTGPVYETVEEIPLS